MKFSLLGLLACLLAGCSLLGGSKSLTQEAYYVPVVTSDRPTNMAPKAYPVHRSDAPNTSERAYYIPVITE
ncbi:hypothetical protein [Marinomonas ostreistagni]|uniref:Lipoprotein n=1 Tax=Marinomonas ostreistagni TaxID=359209 RepID=A0ABS0ZAM1_9GAMM|nr:hypothetical protein [Marinomonas ostreistagni]MBJ7550699.1 hypothetical protein [Marinomonas ostreistagni]